jgi:hypothetical protein
MRARSYLLAAAGGTVVVGGIYLFLQVRGTGAEEPSAEALAAARARHARDGAGVPGGVAGRNRPAGSGEARQGGVLPRPRAGLPMNDPAIFDRPPPLEKIPGGLRGTMQPPIDPDQPELASAMTEANKAYDRGDYEGARQMADKILSREPGNVRMLRVIVSSSCILGEAEYATKYWNLLPPADQQQMAIRCARYQVTFPSSENNHEK